MVWLPTLHAARRTQTWGAPLDAKFPQPKVSRRPAAGIRLLDEAGRLVPPLLDILDVLDGRGVPLATGHASAEEIMALHAHLTQSKSDIPVLVSHVFFKIPALGIEQLRSLVSERTWFEAAYFTVSPQGNATAADVGRRIQLLPNARWILTSDSGQTSMPKSPDALATFALALLGSGSRVRGCGA